MKRLISSVIIISLLCCFSVFVFASDDLKETKSEVPAVTVANFEIPAKSGILMDQITGTILYEKNSHEKMHPASVTKIMTLLLVMEAIDSGKINLQDEVTGSAHASSMGGSQIWIKENERFTVHELLKATAVASANDAAMALAEFVGGSEEGFVAMMNNKAAELTMNDTNFVNPTGLDAEGHMTSAYDIALMSKELMKHNKIVEYTSIWMDSLRDGKTELVNTNKLIRFYKGCTGLKTGTTSQAGSCVSATATKNNMSLISVVMGSGNGKDRFDAARKLLDYGFSNFVMFEPKVSNENLKPVKVTKGTAPNVNVNVDKLSNIIIPRGKEKEVKENVEILPEVEAPIEKGQKIGHISLEINGEKIAEFNINAKDDIARMTMKGAFSLLLKKLVNI